MTTIQNFPTCSDGTSTLPFETICVRYHYGFVLTVDSGRVTKIWCTDCHQAIILSDDTVFSNKEFKQLDWVTVTKDSIPRCKTSDKWFDLRIRNNKIEAEVAVLFFNKGENARSVGFSPSIGKVGAFFNHQMAFETYYKLWVTYIELLPGRFKIVVEKYATKWTAIKMDDHHKMTLFDYSKWDEKALLKGSIARGVVVKINGDMAYVWEKNYGIVGFTKQNVANRLPDVGEFIKGVFVKDFYGTWHLCNAMPADHPPGLIPYDMLIHIKDGKQSEFRHVLLQIDPVRLTLVSNDPVPTYNINGFSKIYDEDNIMKAYEGHRIERLVIKWNEQAQTWHLAHGLCATDIMDERNNRIMLLYARVEKIETYPQAEGPSIEKVVMTPTNLKPYEFCVDKKMFRDPPLLNLWYQLRLSYNSYPVRLTADTNNNDIHGRNVTSRTGSPFYVTIQRAEPVGSYVLPGLNERYADDYTPSDYCGEISVNAVTKDFSKYHL